MGTNGPEDRELRPLPGSDVAMKEVRIGGKGYDEWNCSRLLREILSHSCLLV